VNVVEGILDDLKRGRIPNVFREWGWAAERKHNRTSLIRRILVAGLFTFAALAYLRNNGSNAWWKQ
jgi:hypothetical protein